MGRPTIFLLLSTVGSLFFSAPAWAADTDGDGIEDDQDDCPLTTAYIDDNVDGCPDICNNDDTNILTVTVPELVLECESGARVVTYQQSIHYRTTTPSSYYAYDYQSVYDQADDITRALIPTMDLFVYTYGSNEGDALFLVTDEIQIDGQLFHEGDSSSWHYQSTTQSLLATETWADGASSLILGHDITGLFSDTSSYYVHLPQLGQLHDLTKQIVFEAQIDGDYCSGYFEDGYEGEVVSTVVEDCSLVHDADEDGTVDSADICPYDAANDSDGDGLCADVDACPNENASGYDLNLDGCLDDSDGDQLTDDVDVCPWDADNDADGDTICGDVDICPWDADNDWDGDGLCGDVDACPEDSGNDADGDGVCSSQGDCDDNDTETYAGAPERCDDVDQDCDGVLNLASACSNDCGDDVVETTIPSTLPACASYTQWVNITTLAQLNTWIANPVKGASITANIDAGGQDLSLLSQCDIKLSAGKTISNVGNFVAAARNITLSGNIQATSEVVLRGSTKIYVPTGASMVAANVTIEAPTVDVRGTSSGSGLCMEAASVYSGKDTSWDLAGNEALINSQGTLNLYGDFSNGTAFTAISDGNLYYRTESLLSNVGIVTLSSAATLDASGDITGADSIDADALTFITRSVALWEASGPVMMDHHGTGTMSLSGTISSNASVDMLSNGGLLLYIGAGIVSNGDVAVGVMGYFDGRGLINQNGNVSIDAGTWKLSSTHNFTGNTTCTLHGTRLAGTNPNGCIIQ